MGLQYSCNNQDRILLLKQARIDPPSWAPVGWSPPNAIDYLEVLDEDAPAPTPRQQTLLVHLIAPPPAGLDRDDLKLEGGVRETHVQVVWAQRADAVTIPGEPAAFYAALPSANQILVVRTDKAGDFSDYRLSIVGFPPTEFDPIASSVTFSFKVQCPSLFDCEPPEVCVPATAEGPPIDYLAKDFASFRRVMLDRLAAIVPDWKQRSTADQAIAVVEAIAYVADHLSYQQDATATEAYLGTARRRVSVRRHARLLDYFMHEGTNARVWISLEVGATGDGSVLRRAVGSTRTIFFTRATEGTVLPPAAVPALIDGSRPPLVFEPMQERALYASHDKIDFYTWGDRLCCLPRGATRASLRDDLARRLRLVPGDVLMFEEALGGNDLLAADADPTRRHAVRLTRVTPSATVDAGTLLRAPGTAMVDPLTNTPVVDIEWDREDALPFPFCISAQRKAENDDGELEVVDATIVEGVSVARGNIVLADHGRTYENSQADELPEVTAGRVYWPQLSRGDITHAVPYADQPPFPPASRTLPQDPRAAVPQVVVKSADQTRWDAQPDLLGSNRFSEDFVVEIEDGGEAHLRFGDGTLGRKPDTSGMTAEYRTGRGLAGNVGAEAIAHASGIGLPEKARIRNPLPATGGVDPETLQEVKLYAPQAFRVQDRAVTEADYATVAEQHPEVQKAVATRRWMGSWHTMFVTIDRKEGREVDAAFKREMQAYLERFRLAGYDVEIDGARTVPLDLRLVACVKPEYFRDKVQQALLETFAAGDLRDGQRGFFHPDNFTFGQPVYLSRVVGAAMQVPGVAWVDPTDSRFRFQRFAQAANHELDNGLIAMARLEIARLDNSPNLPENGRLEFVLTGGRA